MGLSLFSDPSQAYTLIPIIWIGVSVLCWLNLSWGVALSGLVVPGFLVPLAMTHPSVAGLILIESILTWLLTHVLCKLMPKFSLGSTFFGRDRFFALVLFGVFVRLFIEQAVLPLTVSLGGRFETLLEFQTNATSFGLVLVPLIANQLWKPGLTRGLASLVAVCSLTYIFTRFIFIPLTHYSIANLALQIDLSAQYLPDSPQSYIVLLTTIFLASRLNLRFGWNFSGIMFPGFIALSLFDPLQIFTTILETLIIALVAKVFMLWLPFRSKALDGSFSIAIFFSLSLAYKLLLGNLIPHYLPGLRAEDFLGLGYLMSSIFAIRLCRMKDHGPQLIATLGQVSLLGAVGGVAIVLVLHNITSFSISNASAGLNQPPVRAYHDSELHIQSQSVSSYLEELAHADYFPKADSERYTVPTKDLLDTIMNRVVHPLLTLTTNVHESQDLSQDAGLKKISQEAGRLGLRIDFFPALNSRKAKILLTDQDSTRNLGLLALTVDAAVPLGIVVGKPFLDRGAFEFALWNLENQNIAFVATAMVHPRTRFDGSSLLTATENKINFVNAFLNQLDGKEFPQLEALELVSIPEGTEGNALAFNPSLDSEASSSLLKWTKELAQKGMPVGYDPQFTASYTFDATLSAVGKQIRLLAIPAWVQDRMRPIQENSHWTHAWSLMGRAILERDPLDISSSNLQSLQGSYTQALRDYIADSDPVHLLKAEALDANLRFDMWKNSDDRDEFILVTQSDEKHLFRLTGFDGSTRPLADTTQSPGKSRL
ncbi:MAG: poly-gamma-glutamate biosynthesis protein PgsC/CapC [Oligoflexus sp.]|nr:poly-gamma-glutamate biosynthesis protein PgsC/CapC [Oligoflexus sp.]